MDVFKCRIDLLEQRFIAAIEFPAGFTDEVVMDPAVEDVLKPFTDAW